MSSTVLQSISFDLEHSVLLLNYVLAELVLIFFFPLPPGTQSSRNKPKSCYAKSVILPFKQWLWYRKAHLFSLLTHLEAEETALFHKPLSSGWAVVSSS